MLGLICLHCCCKDITSVGVLGGFQRDTIHVIAAKDMVKVIDNACAFQLQQSLFLRPETSKGNVWERVGKDGFRFFRTHRMANKVWLRIADTFDVQATRTIADETACSLPTMADAEVHIGMFSKVWLAVLVISKGWHFVNAKTQPKRSQ